MLNAILISVLAYFAIAVGLILSQRIGPLPPAHTLSFESLGAVPEHGRIGFTARDGTNLPVRHYAGFDADAPLVVVVHGSGWHGGSYTGIGAALAAQGFEVLIPDLRGHGTAPARRGDIDYIGQFEDDLADLITAFRQTSRPVYMVGHSSGGGLVIRFAGGAYSDMIAKAVLIAPFVHHTAPTARADTGGWAHVLVRRVIGLSMLNMVRITALNHLHMIQFRFPDAVLNGPQGQTATRSYSYRLNTSFAPRHNYKDDIAKLPPFLLVAGTKDEAFTVQAYEPTLSAANPNGRYALIDGQDHLSILTDPTTLDRIGAFLKRF